MKNKRVFLCISFALFFLLSALLTGCSGDSFSIDKETKAALTDSSDEKVYKIYAGWCDTFFEYLYCDTIDLDLLRNEDNALYIGEHRVTVACFGHYYVVADREGNQIKFEYTGNEYLIKEFSKDKANRFADLSYILKYAENPNMLFTPNVYVKETFIYHNINSAEDYAFVYYVTNIGDYVLIFDDIKVEETEIFDKNTLTLTYEYSISDYSLYLIPAETYCEYVHFEKLGQIEGKNRYREIEIEDYRFSNRIFGIESIVKKVLLQLTLCAIIFFAVFVFKKMRDSRGAKCFAKNKLVQIISLSLVLLILCVCFNGNDNEDSISVDNSTKEYLTDNKSDRVYKIYAGYFRRGVLPYIRDDLMELDDLNNQPYKLALNGYYYEILSENGGYKDSYYPNFANGLYLEHQISNDRRLDHVYRYIDNPQLLFSPSVKIKNTYILIDKEYYEENYEYIYYVTDVGDYILILDKEENGCTAYFAEINDYFDTYTNLSDDEFRDISGFMLTEPISPITNYTKYVVIGTVVVAVTSLVAFGVIKNRRKTLKSN